MEIELEDVEVLETLQDVNSLVLKYHNFHPSAASFPDCEVSTYHRELAAYRRLKAEGFCERRVIPDFYGTIKNIDPSHWPYLWKFVDDELPPTAILIEYAPNMHRIDLSNFSPQNMQILRETLAEMHSVGVLHGDAETRNMVVSKDPTTNQDRALWLDFDRAHTFSECLSERQESWMKEEMERMDYFVQYLTQDNEQGELYHAYSFYYDWVEYLGWAEDYEWVKEEIAARKYNPFKHEGAKLQKWLDSRKDNGMEWNGADWVQSKSMRWNGQVYVEIEDGADRSPNYEVSENEIEIAQPCGEMKIQRANPV
ncbi:unnamed protein product [Penicillium manginii]